MSINTVNNPSLRFPGYERDWEQKKLSECFEERNEQFPESSEYPLMAFVADKGVSPKGEKYDRSALVKDATNKKYKRTEFGDFIYSSNNLEAGSIGFNKYGKACISPVYSIFKAKESIDPIFIGTLLTQKSFISTLAKFRQGVVYGQWKIPEKEFLGLTISLPSQDEQEKIANCLTAIDNIVTAQDQKVEALKEKKKGLMQQLFPQAGETAPRLRFPGFSGEWVEKKFKDITVPAGKKNRQNLPYERYSISNEVGFYPQSNQFEDGGGYLKDIDCRQYIIVPPKSFAYNPARINVGSIGYQDLGKEVIVSSLYEVFQTKTDCDDAFLWQWFHTDVFHKMVVNVQEGGVRQYFFYEKLKECAINMPSIPEQKKIANCLSAVDYTIQAETDKLEALKAHKKGLMQQLFPNQ